MTSAEDPKPLRDQIVENQRIIDELNRTLSRKTQEVRIIQQISSDITSTLELETILSVILASMDKVLGFQHSMILLAAPDGKSLSVAASRGFEESGVGAEVPVGVGVVGVVAKRKKIMRMGGIASGVSYTGGVRTAMEQAGQSGRMGEVAKLPGLKNVQSQIAIPLLVKDKLIGVFAVESAKPVAFDELDEVLITIIANQAASAIENARLYQEEERRVSLLHEAQESLSRLNEDLEGKVRERTAEIEKVNQNLTSALDEVSREKHRSHDLLGRMAPPEVVPLMLEGKLLARKLNATVLFTDLEGFTRFSSDMEPDELFSKLNDFFSRAGESIQRYRGYVNKTNGDSIMALFGVPYENKTHALDAVLASLDMQREIQSHFSLKMRIGINTGPLNAGILGPSNKSLYDVLGDAVNVASRMEKVCPPGGVCVAEDTYRLVEPYFEIRSLGEQNIKGKGSLPCFEVVGIKKLYNDHRRVDESSLFNKKHLDVIKEVEEYKRDRLSAIDFLSIQSRDGAVNHNEAVASFSLALYKHLRSGSPSVVDGIKEEDVLLLGLLHDLGKHAVSLAALNDPDLGLPDLERLRAELRKHTHEALVKLGLDRLPPSLGSFYDLEQDRGASLAGAPAKAKDADTVLSWIVGAADIYDALTAPKIYKGKGWTIAGSLEELLRMPVPETTYQVFRSFVELMRPEKGVIAERKDRNVLFR